jgi:hypothetical protein
MNLAFDDALIDGWEPLEAGIELPDPNDCHVIAAALRAGADVIVTQNLKDFPADTLTSFGLEAVSVDSFLLDQLDFTVSTCLEVIREQALATRNPKITAQDLLSQLERAGAPRFASRVRDILGDGIAS